MSLKLLLGLIFCNVLWSAHPAMGKLVLMGFPPSQAAWLRYFSALVSYFLALGILKIVPGTRRRFKKPFIWPAKTSDRALLGLLGFLAFCFSPLLQMTGLAASRATDNALIIAMEPLMTVFMAWVVLGERLTRLHIIAFAVALLGFALLTGLTPSQLKVGFSPELVGNLIILASLVGEASYSTLGRKLLLRFAPAGVFGSALLIGVGTLTLITAWISGLPTLDSLIHMPWQSLAGLIWLGPFGTAFSYLFWMSVLNRASVASLALTLFVQPLLGPVWGALFLGERMTPIQIVGSLLILAAVFGQTWAERRVRRAPV